MSAAPRVIPPRVVPLLTVAELAAMPAVEWLVDEVLPAGSDTMLYGHPGSFKSLLAVDLACAIATGRLWHGRTVQAAPVVYIVGEGRHGLAARFASYQDRHGITAEGIYLVPEPLSLLDMANAPALLAALDRVLPPDAAERPVLLIVDTVRKCTPGGDENESGMVSEALVFVDRLRREFPQLTALLLHHPGVSGNRPRGSSAWEADIDTVLKTEREGKALEVRLLCEKQRDSEPFDTLIFDVVAHAGSITLDGRASWQVSDRRTLSTVERTVLAALDDLQPEAVSWTRWQAVAEVGPSTLSRARKRLLDLGYVRSEGPANGLRYFITGEGIAAVASPEDFHGTSTGHFHGLPSEPQNTNSLPPQELDAVTSRLPRDFHGTSTEGLPLLPGALIGPRREAGSTEA